MALSRPQQILLKRAQAQAGIGDSEYREHLQTVAGVQSSTDPAIGDEQLDVLMAFFEGIYWRTYMAGLLPAPRRGDPFMTPGYWASKNTAQSTSRDRFTGQNLAEEIRKAEADLASMGFGPGYCYSIRNRVATAAPMTPPRQRAYLAALNRTIAAKRKGT